MTITKQILKKVKRLLMYPVLLFTGAFGIVCIFGVIYYVLEVPEPFFYSMQLFLDNVIQRDSVNNIYFISITEVAVKYLFSLIFTAGYLSKFLQPLNPIVTPKYFIYDEASGEIKFRYWIMLSGNEFLYDLHIRVAVMDDDEKTMGTGSIGANSDLMIEANRLELARGVREARVVKRDVDYPKMLIKDLGNGKNFYFMITATTENGKRIYHTKKYTKKDLVKNCDYVPIRSTSFYKEGEGRLFFRYHHFDMLYVRGDTDLKRTNALKKAYPCANKNILSQDDIKVGQYGRRGYVLKDLCSEIISWYLNR